MIEDIFNGKYRILICILITELAALLAELICKLCLSPTGPIKCLTFDSLGEYVVVAGDRHIKIFRNIPGYRASIETSRKKLAQRQTSATKERLEKTIADCEKFLKDMGERCP